MADPKLSNPGVFYYKLDSDFTDAFGNGPTLAGTSEGFVPGKVNNAVDFENANSQSVTSTAVPTALSQTIKTIDLWIKPETNVHNYHAIVLSDGTSANRLLVHNENGDIRCAITNGSSVSLISTTGISPGVDMHIVFTFGPDGAKLFINGVEEASSASTLALNDQYDTLFIGANQTASDFWDGLIDNVYFSSDQYTAADALASFNSGNGTEFDTTPIEGKGTMFFDFEALKLKGSKDGETFEVFDSITEPAGKVLGFLAGGRTGAVAPIAGGPIESINTTTESTAGVDAGDLSVARRNGGGLFSSTVGFFLGGAGGGNVIDSIDITISADNAVDSGDLTISMGNIQGVSGSVNGFVCGDSGGSPNIETIPLTSTGNNASDIGNMSQQRFNPGGVHGATLGFWAGGDAGGANFQNTIDFITLASTSQNSLDSGDLTLARGSAVGVEDETNGFWCGGLNPGETNVIDTIAHATSGSNATDTGDLTVSRHDSGGSVGAVFGYICGGSDGGGGPETNIIDVITLATTTQNSSDSGDLVVSRYEPLAV